MSTAVTPAARRPPPRDAPRLPTPAQGYCALAGLGLFVGGILGFFAEASFGDADDRDELLGLLAVNGWHNVVHLLSGLVLLAAAPRALPARATAGLFALAYGAVTVYGLVDGDDVLGLLPINTADNVLHIALTVLGLLAAVAPAHDLRRPPPRAPEPERFPVLPDASSPKQVFVGVDRPGR